MKIALFNDNQPGIVLGNQLVDVSSLVAWNKAQPQASLIELIRQFPRLQHELEVTRARLPVYALSEVTLRAPVPNPSKIVAAPVNYVLHQDEMNVQFQNAEYTVEKLGFFLKAPSSIIGPGQTVRLPNRDRRFDHEAELAFVIGKEAKDVLREDAHDYIFGYFALMDITMRGKEDRPMRKSYDTFTPIGPFLVTGDELGDPNQLDIELWVNDELRQSANTRDLIYDCYTFLEVVSQVMTLYPGDIVTTGTPEGVGPIQAGDRVKIRIDRIGDFFVDVANRSEV